jgi:hypothetical protein
VLRGIVNSPWYIRNEDLHRDLRMDYVDEEIQKYARNYEGRLLLDNSNQRRRLKSVGVMCDKVTKQSIL